MDGDLFAAASNETEGRLAPGSVLEFHASKTTEMLTLVLGLALLVLGGAMAGVGVWGLVSGELDLPEALLALIPGLTALYFVGRIVHGRTGKGLFYVQLSPAGFIVEQPRGGRLEHSWADVKEVYQSSVRATVNGLGRTSHRLTVVLTNGAKFAIGDPFERVDVIAQVFHKQSVRHHFVPTQKQIEGGEPALFGPLTLSLDGVNKGSKRLAWSEVSPVVVERGLIIIKERGGRRQRAWFQRGIAGIPNPAVFMALFDHYRRQAR